MARARNRNLRKARGLFHLVRHHHRSVTKRMAQHTRVVKNIVTAGLVLAAVADFIFPPSIAVAIALAVAIVWVREL